MTIHVHCAQHTPSSSMHAMQVSRCRAVRAAGGSGAGTEPRVACPNSQLCWRLHWASFRLSLFVGGTLQRRVRQQQHSHRPRTSRQHCVSRQSLVKVQIAPDAGLHAAPPRIPENAKHLGQIQILCPFVPQASTAGGGVQTHRIQAKQQSGPRPLQGEC
jgi:hypothetical protein